MPIQNRVDIEEAKRFTHQLIFAKQTYYPTYVVNALSFKKVHKLTYAYTTSIYSVSFVNDTQEPYTADNNGYQFNVWQGINYDGNKGIP